MKVNKLIALNLLLFSLQPQRAGATLPYFPNQNLFVQQSNHSPRELSQETPSRSVVENLNRDSISNLQQCRCGIFFGAAIGSITTVSALALGNLTDYQNLGLFAVSSIGGSLGVVGLAKLFHWYLTLNTQADSNLSQTEESMARHSMSSTHPCTLTHLLTDRKVQVYTTTQIDLNSETEIRIRNLTESLNQSFSMGDECPICMTPWGEQQLPDSSQVYLCQANCNCKYFFCPGCSNELTQSRQPRCPSCRETMGTDQFIFLVTESPCKESDSQENHEDPLPIEVESESEELGWSEVPLDLA